MSISNRSLSRRGFIAAGALSIIGIAGCSSNTQPGSNETDNPANTPIETNEPEQVEIGEMFTIPGMFEVTLESAEWRDEVSFGNSSFKITPGTAVDGATYYVITAKIKNIGTAKEEIGMGETNHLASIFKFNNTYDIDANMVVDTGSGYTDEIDPLMEENVVIYGSVSDEIKDQFEDCQLTLTARQPDDEGVWTIGEDPLGEYTATFE